jgi:hypothetical protein
MTRSVEPFSESESELIQMTELIFRIEDRCSAAIEDSGEMEMTMFADRDFRIGGAGALVYKAKSSASQLRGWPHRTSVIL